MLIQEHYATLRELEEYYSYSDMLDLLEALYVAKTNEQISFNSQKKA